MKIVLFYLLGTLLFYLRENYKSIYNKIIDSTKKKKL